MCSDTITTSGAYRGGFPEVSRNPFGFYTPTEIEAKGWNLSWNRTPLTLYLTSVMVSHMIATLIALFLNYDFGEKIEIL